MTSPVIVPEKQLNGMQDMRSSIETIKKQVRIDAISIEKNELQLFVIQFKVSTIVFLTFFQELITNTIFLYTTLSLCCLYFVVTGI